MENFNKITNLIKQAQNILIISHVNPDGDTLGSMLGLSIAIKENFGKTSDTLVLGKIPDIYEFLPEIQNTTNIDNFDTTKVYDLAIAVDIAAKERMRNALDCFNKAKTTINFDHHKTNPNYANINIVFPNASSTGEVIFDYLENQNLKMTTPTATCLYTAILTDTGCFKFETTTQKVFKTAMQLLEYGIKPDEIARNCYDSKPMAMVRLQAYCVNNAVFEANGKIAYCIITNEDMRIFNAQSDHTDGISEALRQIKTVDVSMTLKEIDSQSCKISLRSKNIDLCKVVELFNGGGHKLAAGCTIKKPAKIAADKLVEEIKKYL